MKKVDLKKILKDKKPELLEKYPKWFTSLVIGFLDWVLITKRINSFLDVHNDKKSIDFIDALFEYIDFSYMVSEKDIKKIPAEGKVILTANHPLGALDGLSILKMIYEVRKDVKVVVNDVLMNLENIQDLFIPYDIYSNKTQKKSIVEISRKLQSESAIVFFPSGEVSRYTFKGIRDKKWHNGAIFFAQKFEVPIVPIYVDAYNSNFFYFVSMIFKSFSTFLLPREIFKKTGKTIRIKIGDPIPGKTFKSKAIKTSSQSKLLRKHTYKIGTNRKGIFRTEKTIIHPVNRKILKNQLLQSELLIDLNNDKKIYLTEFSKSPDVIKEISRLRELTFRKIGEGSGSKQDSDTYDKYYKHIVLWDNKELDIIGSYRLAKCSDIINNSSNRDLYTSTLFDFSDSLLPILNKSVELGRSFIQHKYWKTKALDYLWQGIGSYLLRNEKDIKYLIGAVSISDNFSEAAKSLIVSYYKKWFSSENIYAHAKNPFMISASNQREANQILSEEDFQKDYRLLKKTLKSLGYTVPVLFRRYTELCDYGGVKFTDFTVDESFSNCIDAFMILDLTTLKDKPRERYFIKQNQ